MTLDDRLAMGFFAGVIGGIAMNIVNLLSFSAGIAELRYLDWAAIVIFGTKPVGLVEVAFALVAQILFVGVLGIVFAYLIPVLSSRNHLLRGWLFGVVVWFSLYGITLLFKVQQTIPLRVDTAASDLVGATVYGLVLAESLRRLNRQVDI